MNESLLAAELMKLSVETNKTGDMIIDVSYSIGFFYTFTIYRAGTNFSERSDGDQLYINRFTKTSGEGFIQYYNECVSAIAIARHKQEQAA